MNNVVKFRSAAELEERDVILREIKELGTLIDNLRMLITKSIFSHRDAPKNFDFNAPRNSLGRLDPILRREFATLQGRRTRLLNKLDRL